MVRSTIKSSRALVLAGFCLLLGLTGCRETTSDVPPVHLNPNMDNQAYLEAQEPALVEVDGELVFEDKSAMRPYVDGTVAYGHEGIASDPSAQRAATHFYKGKTGPEAYFASLPPQIPFETEKQKRRIIERGKDRYDIFCSHCHGATGVGNGIVVSKRMTPPPTYHDAQRRSYPVGRFFDTITNGVGNMPALASQIPPEDRWAIAVWVRTLQVSHNKSLSELPEGALEEIKKREGWK